jgi:hypothetical protein
LSSKPGTDPINIKNDYFRWINVNDSTPSFAALLKFVKDNPKSSQSDIIAFVNAGNDDIKFLARSIVLLWYLGSWYKPEDLQKQATAANPAALIPRKSSPRRHIRRDWFGKSREPTRWATAICSSAIGRAIPAIPMIKRPFYPPQTGLEGGIHGRHLH